MTISTRSGRQCLSYRIIIIVIDVARKKTFIISSFVHCAQVTNKLRLLLTSRFPFRKDVQKPLLFETYSRGGLSPGTISLQLEQPRLKSLYCSSNNQQIAVHREFIVCFYPCLIDINSLVMMFKLGFICISEDFNLMKFNLYLKTYPLGTERKLKVHKTTSRCPERLQNILCTFGLSAMC